MERHGHLRLDPVVRRVLLDVSGSSFGRLWPAERSQRNRDAGAALPKRPLYVNFFQPSFKLASNQRDGALVRRRYHPPLTPCQRLLASPIVEEPIKEQLRHQFAALDPVALLKTIRDTRKSLPPSVAFAYKLSFWRALRLLDSTANPTSAVRA